MTKRSVTHATFTIERSYPVETAQVFAAFASAEAKARWMDSPQAQPAGDIREFDFRVGGRERFGAKVPDGPTYTYDALYYDIVPDQRIVYCYEMCADDARISVSVATIEFARAAAGAAGTKLTYTEHGAFLDGLDQAEYRKHGTEEMFDNLAGELRSQPAD